MLVSSKKIEKMLRDRDRLERMAKIEYQEAKDLFSVGNMEFAIELQLANQHLSSAAPSFWTGSCRCPSRWPRPRISA